MRSILATFLTIKNLRKYFFIFTLLTITFFGIFTIYNKFIYSFNFTDEGDNISIGKYLREDKKLYRDVFSQHQPVTYFMSSTLQELTNPDNVLLVVRRHRQAVILFSFAWIVFLTLRFGYRLLPFLFIIELLKYYYLGHLFLAESLVIYPLGYLFCLWWQVANKNVMTKFDALIASLSAFFVVFNLLPTVFAVGFMMLSFLFYTRRNYLLTAFLILPAFLAIAIIFFFVPFTSYFETTIWANIFYYIPNSNQIAFQVKTGPFHIVQNMLLWPLTYFTEANNLFGFVQVLLVTFWVAGALLYLSLTKRYLLISISYLTLALLNTRPPIGSLIYYHIFHSLPFFASFVISLGLFWQEVMKSPFSLRTKIIYTLPLFFLFFLFTFNKGFYYRETFNEQVAIHVQYSHIITYSYAVRSLASGDDTFAVYPYEELLYWYSNVSPPTRFLFYQSWVTDVPQYRKEIMTAMTAYPPAFVYAPSGMKIAPYLSLEDYTALPLHETSQSALLIRNEKLRHLSDKQWEDMFRLGFKKPASDSAIFRNLE